MNDELHRQTGRPLPVTMTLEEAAYEYLEGVTAYLNPENQYTDSRRKAMEWAERELRRALSSEPASTGLNDGPWQQMSDVATQGPWYVRGPRDNYIRAGYAPDAKTVADVRYKNGDADAAFIVACVNYVRSRLSVSSPQSRTVFHFEDGTTGPGDWDPKAGKVVPSSPQEPKP